MDEHRFDNLTRALARGHSRRTMLKGLASGTVGGFVALVGRQVEARPNCRDAGHPCEGNQSCCAGLVCQASSPGAALRCTTCPDGTIPCGNTCIPACTASDPCHAAGVCVADTGQCTNPPLIDGTSCAGDNPCFHTYTCQQGSCSGSDPVVCGASDQCHDAGTCNPATGQCSNPAKSDGSTCDDGNLCTIGDTCQGGTCVGGPSRACAEGKICATISCNPSTGQCDQETPAPDGTSCSSGNACIEGETCLGGTCQGGAPKTCFDSNPCTTDGCDATGLCVFTPVPDGTDMPACNSNPMFNVPNACYGGQCCISGPGNYACFSDAACCPGLRCFCSPSGCFNNSGQCLKCAPSGFGCATNQDCCSGTCTSGVCG